VTQKRDISGTTTYRNYSMTWYEKL